MNKELDKFIKIYNESVIQESFGQALKNVGNGLLRKATFGLAGKTKNESLSENLAKALSACNFDVDSDDENFSEASIVISNGKEGDKLKYYKIIVSNDYSKGDDNLTYSIRCKNVISGKNVKIRSKNFTLKPSWNAEEIISKGINPCIHPLKVYSGMEDLSDEAKEYKNQIEQNQNQEKEAKNAENEKASKLKDLKNKVEKIEQLVDSKSGKIDDDIINDAYKKIDEVKDLFEDKSDYETIKSKYKELYDVYRKINQLSNKSEVANSSSNNAQNNGNANATN